MVLKFPIQTLPRVLRHGTSRVGFSGICLDLSLGLWRHFSSEYMSNFEFMIVGFVRRLNEFHVYVALAYIILQTSYEYMRPLFLYNVFNKIVRKNRNLQRLRINQCRPYIIPEQAGKIITGRNWNNSLIPIRNDQSTVTRMVRIHETEIACVKCCPFILLLDHHDMMIMAVKEYALSLKLSKRYGRTTVKFL